jgi:hypothetical protein
VLFANPELMDRLDFAIGREYAERLIDDFGRNRLSGLHLNAFTRQPFALVEASETWSVTLRHEILEMIVDPYGNRLIAAAHPVRHRQRVKYLVEVCDALSDDVVPRERRARFRLLHTPGTSILWWSTLAGTASLGALERPLPILDGGYLSWIDPEDSGLYQLGAGETETVLIADLLQLARSTAPLRTVVDTNPRTPQVTRASLTAAASARAAFNAYDVVLEASEGAGLRTAETVASLAAGAG